jgi:hypothetical protein
MINMKKGIIVLAVMGCSVMMINCTRSSEQKVAQVEKEIVRDITKEKQETTKDLQTLRDDINAKLDKISKKLEGANGVVKSELESVKAILIEHRSKVEVALDLIDHSADDTWDNAQQSAKNTQNEVKLACEKISERYDNALKNSDK